MNIRTIMKKLLGEKELSIPEHWVLGVDISSHQGKIDFEIMKHHPNKVKFVITKATDVGSVSNQGFVDRDAVKNYFEMKRSGFLTGAYHWLDPRGKRTGTQQADYYLNNFYIPYPTDLPPICDFEDKEVISWNHVFQTLIDFMNRVEFVTKEIPILYTSPGYIGNFTYAQRKILSKYILWQAQYIQDDKPTPIKGMPLATFWQYSDKGHHPTFVYKDTQAGRGKNYGVESFGLDMNYYLNDYLSLLKMCNKDESPKFQAICVRFSWVKTAPKKLYPKVRPIFRGTIVDVYEEKFNYFKISKDKEEWVSGYKRYFVKIN